MAVRFTSQQIFSVNDSAVYVVYIDDADHISGSTEFKVTPNGFGLRPDGQNGQRLLPVSVTEFSMDMFIENSTHRGLINDLTESAEGRFKVKVTKDGNLHYVGNVVIDVGSYEDRAYPYTFTLKATDLGSLATIDYRDGVDTPYDGWDTLLGHAVRCIDKTGLLEFGWSGSDIALSVIDNWYEDSITPGNDKDPFALTRCHHRTFYEVDTKGNFKFLSALDVLKQVCQIKGLNLRQSAGRFRFLQVTALYEDTPRARHYDKDGTYLSNSADTYTLDISGQDTDGAKLAGGQYTWLAPFKEVRLRYVHRNWENIISGAILGDGISFTGPDLVAAVNPFNLLASLKVQRTLVNGGTPSGTAYFEKYKFQFKVGGYYLKRNHIQITNGGAQYEQPSWTTTDSWYYFSFLNTGYFPANGGSGQLTDTYEFAIPPFPADGASTFKCEQAGFQLASGSGVPSISFGATIVITGFVGVNYNAEAEDQEHKVENPTTSANSFDLPLTTYIGDGPTANTTGRLQVSNNGSTWTDANLSGGWTVGGTGTEYLLQDLLIKELMSGQTLPIQKMEHTVGYAHGYEPHMRLHDGSNVWAFLGGTFSARYNDWQGAWYKVAYDPTGVTPLPPVPVPTIGGLPPVKQPTLPGGTVTPLPPSPVPQLPPTLPPSSQGEHFLIGLVSGVSTSGAIPIGPVGTIRLSGSLTAGAYQAGQQITVVDAVGGTTSVFTVAATSQDGDTEVAVTGYAVTDIPAGAFIVTPQSAGILQGQGNPAASNGLLAMPWPLIEQRWTRDDTNDPLWPIEAFDIGIETNEDAGNGSTAGLRIDGDGVTSYSASSATPGVKVGTDGKLYLANLDTATGTDGLVLEGGVVKKKTLSAGVTDHGALSGLGDDDHTQYVLLLGRSGGQTLYGGTAAFNNLILYSTSNGSRGVIYLTDQVHLGNVPTGSGTAGLILEGGVIKQKTLPTVITDHGGLSGLGDDDHTQYVLLAGRGVSQTIHGATSAGGHLYLKSTSSGTVGNIYAVHTLIGQSGFDFRTNQSAGNGSTAGITLTDGNGIRAYKSTSSQAVFHLKETGILLFDYGSHPTFEANIFYVKDGVLHIDVGGDANKVHPQYGHIRDFQVIGINTNWTTGTKDAFWRVSSEYAGYEVWFVVAGVGSTAGSGGGNNTVNVFHLNAAGTVTTTIYSATCNATSPTTALATNFVSLAAGDMIYFNVGAVRSTPAQGLYIELYIRKT